MALITEDGTLVDSANGLITVAYADSYHSDRGHDQWTGTDAQKESAIVRATDHVARVFGSRLKGIRVSVDQALPFPRSNIWVDGVLQASMPQNLLKAVAEYALRSLLYHNLSPDMVPFSPRQSFATGGTGPEEGDALGIPESTLTKVGPITEQSSMYSIAEELFSRGQTSIEDLRYPAADMLMRTLLRPQNNRLIRG